MKDTTKTKVAVTVGSIVAAGFGALLGAALAGKKTGVVAGARPKLKGCGGCGR